MLKVTVIGAGNVGATVAECVARKDMVKEVVLIDIKEGLSEGKALDITESAPIHLFDTIVRGVTNDYDQTSNSDICVITSGVPRRPGMSRDDLLGINANIVRSVTEAFVERSPNAIIIVISNPLDVMTYVAHEPSLWDGWGFGYCSISSVHRHGTQGFGQGYQCSFDGRSW